MVSARQHRVFTLEEYLDVERKASAKSEFVDGAVYAMPGGSVNHALIGMSAGAALKTLLRGKACRVFNSELQVFEGLAALAVLGCVEQPLPLQELYEDVTWET